MQSTAGIRQAFLDFFRQKGHQIVPSAPIVNKDDPSLMFINAGMNPFKDLLTASAPPEQPRIADTQKCLRVSGKHNDLEEVGHDTYHHTMFEMLGNWSFGDYFKPEAIAWAWELLTEVYGLPPERLYATVFEGDAGIGLGPDEEAIELWQAWLPAERILRFDKTDNFWEMGETGPCGPCSEIHIDLRPEAERRQQDGRNLVNADHPEVIEIWNLVFIAYERLQDGRLRDLALKSIDTGMGLERLAMVLQDKRATYDIDIFQELMSHLEDAHGCRYARGGQEAVAMRVAVDHLRAVAFTIADGQLPANTGAGYVIRRIIRRASRYGFQFLGIRTPYLHAMVPHLSRQFADVFPELAAQADFVQQVLEQEEASFLRTLERGTKRFADYLEQQANVSSAVVDGGFAFELYDTYGFPLDLTELMAREHGWRVDEEGFRAHMAEQKARSKQAQTKEAGDWQDVFGGEGTAFEGYEHTELTGVHIRRWRRLKTQAGESVQVVLDRTPFYAESGGQVGDTGWLKSPGETLNVLDTRYENDQIVHLCDRAPAEPEADWTAAIDRPRRERIRANHSATHLLHEALRRVLGEHVEQRGSLVAPEYLRFDFSHFQKLTADELTEVQQLVNAKIAGAIPLEERRRVPIADAKAMGARALFGEKYGEEVRVIRFSEDYSTELCGGTHVPNTLHIRYFHITGESAVAAGVRRIEAITGEAALSFVDEQLHKLAEMKRLLKQPKDLVAAVENLVSENKRLGKQVEALQQQQANLLRDQLLAQVESYGDVQALLAEVEVDSADALKKLVMALRGKLGRGVVLLGTVAGGKPLLSGSSTEELIASPGAAEDVLSHRLIKAVAADIGGGGGGKPQFASAGGKNPAGLPQALAHARELLRAYAARQRA